MTFSYNERQYSYPSSLADITIGQRIGFHKLYGIKMQELIQELDTITDETERQIENSRLQLLFATQSFSYFTGIPLHEVHSYFDLAQITNLYSASLALLLEQEQGIELKEVYDYNNEQWYISPPKVVPQSKITFNEFLVSKEIVRQMDQLGKGNWEVLPYLCCIYLRKKDEEFSDEFIEGDSERMKLMMNLPLDIALAVGFFLSSSMTTFSSILLSSKEVAGKELT